MPERPRRATSRPVIHAKPRHGPSAGERLIGRIGAAWRLAVDRVGAVRSLTVEHAAPLAVALIVLGASIASVPAVSGATAEATVASAPRLTVDDPVLGPPPDIGAVTSSGSGAATVAGPPLGAVVAGGPSSDPWVFTPVTVDAGGDLSIAQEHLITATPRPKATPRISTTSKSRPAVNKTPGFAPLLWPVPGGYISQGFGCTGFPFEPPYGSCPHFHSGLDIAAPEGTRILAAAAGTVVFAGWKSNGGGFQVWVSDGANLYTGYHHMSSIAVYAGEHVKRGQRIGAVGMTGNATGPHCHFMVSIGPFWAGGTPVDPRRYL